MACEGCDRPTSVLSNACEHVFVSNHRYNVLGVNNFDSKPSKAKLKINLSKKHSGIVEHRLLTVCMLDHKNLDNRILSREND